MKKIFFAVIITVISATLIFGQKTFENKKFGISIQEPKGWVVTGNEELLKNIEKMDFTEENLDKIFKNEKQVIFLTAFTKYKLNERAGLIPKIQISVNPLNTKDFEKFKAAITKTAGSYKTLFENYEFIQEPQEIKIQGIQSVTFTVKFTIKTQDGLELKSRSRIIAIPYKNYFFQLSFVDEEVGENNAELFDELIKTIKIG